jgi:hypothetical protein
MVRWCAPSRGTQVGSESVSFSPDGRLLASGSVDRTIKLWSTTATQSVPAGQVHTAPRSTPALQSAPSSQPSGYAPTPPPTPTPAQASRRRYGAWVWSVLAILLIGLCVINLLPDGSPVAPSRNPIKEVRMMRGLCCQMVPRCAPSRGTQMGSGACRFRRMGVCWRRGVRIRPSSCGVFRMERWCAPSRGTQMGS